MLAVCVARNMLVEMPESGEGKYGDVVVCNEIAAWPETMAAAHKLVVGVTSAQGLMPKDGQGSSSAYVELCFHGQRFRTATKGKDLNPVWNKRFYFDISDPSLLPELALDAYVVHRVSESELVDLGKVRIAGASFLPFADAAAAVPYVLKKRRLSSHVKGTLALKVYITDDTSITASNNPKSILRDQSSRPHSIPLHHLKAITNNFSDNRVLGRGGFGVVYRGVLQNGEMIAVKKMMSSLLPGPQKQFENEVYHLMKLKHPNIVRCVGYCYEIQNACVEFNGKYVFAEQTERLLCLEYLHKRSLDMYLSDESSGLDWSTRYKIIKGISYGLCHLHEQNDKPILHLDLKPANILLDDSMEPKITDFGLSRLLDQEQTICTSSRDGTFGYMAPEFLHGGTITPKSDIFSLGVIIMEIVTGHRDYPDVTRTSSDDFIELALKKWRNTLGGAPGYRSLEIELQQVKTCIQVGLNCVNPEHSERPTITEIINMLQGPKIIDCSISHATTLPICSRSADSVVSIDSDVLKSLAWRGFFLKKKKKYMLKNLPKLSRQELEVVCESFSNVIGSTPGTLVYKGTMKDGPEVSVISVCVLECHWTSQHELLYQNKVVDLARLNHENIAKFLGYCREKDLFSRMVVFEYASNGTLYEHLHHGEASQLCWLRRMKIAIGIAQGLRYLHTELQPPFSISELNSNSVYVAEDFTPKLVYFECWEVMFSKHEKALGQLNDKSAFPCLKQNNPSFPSPDSAEDKNADMQSNVFAFGIILLEIISGRLPYCKDKGHLVDWAKEYLQRPGEIWKLVDPELGNVRTEDLAVICGVVRRCIDPILSMRPTMQIIAETLETGIDLSAAGILNESNSLACAELALSLFNTFRLQSGCSKCIYEIIETDHPSACLICGGTHRTRIRLPHHACARKVGSPTNSYPATQN